MVDLGAELWKEFKSAIKAYAVGQGV